jgi:hypothetical protein
MHRLIALLVAEATGGATRAGDSVVGEIKAWWSSLSGRLRNRSIDLVQARPSLAPSALLGELSLEFVHGSRQLA